MIVLSWQMTIVAVVLLPVLVIAQRRVGQVRARIATKTQESLSDMTAITQETLSVSGILLAKSFNQQKTEVGRYTAENQNQIALQIRQTMSGQWFFAIVGIFLSVIPAVIYLVAAWLIYQDVPGHRGHGRRVHDGAGAADVPADGAAAGRARPADLAGAVRPHLRVPRPEAGDPGCRGRPRRSTPARLGEVAFDDVVFRYPDAPDDSPATLKGVSFAIEPGQYAAFVGPSGAGKTTVSYLVPRLHDVTSGRVLFAGDDVRELQQESLIGAIGIVSQETYLFHATIAENLRYAKPGRDRRRAESRRRRRRTSTTRSRRSPTATTPSWASAATGCRAARSSASRSRGCCSRIPRC